MLKSVKNHSTPLLEKELADSLKLIGHSTVYDKVDNSDSDSSYYFLKFEDKRIKLLE